MPAAQDTQQCPDHLAEFAKVPAERLNPDGPYTDEDRARSGGLMLGNQQADGMSELRAMVTPELRHRRSRHGQTGRQQLIMVTR